MKKEERLRVYKMYDGHCAYCGKPIKYEEMQVDHFVPKNRGHYSRWSEKEGKFVVSHGEDDISNYMPSCRACNFRKRDMSIEQFREAIKEQAKGLLKGAAKFQVSMSIAYSLLIPAFESLSYSILRSLKRMINMTLEERIEKIRATRHAYYLKHKEKMRAYSKEWYSKHPEKWREYQKRHPEKRRQYQNTYYQKNKEKLLAYQKEWRKAHPEKFKAYRKKSLQNQLLGIAAKRPRQKPAKSFDTEKLAHIFKDPATAAHYKKVIQLNEQTQKCAL